MTEPTPGPLTITGPSPGKMKVIDDGGDYGILDSNGRMIGEAYRVIGIREVADARANATLWSASPVLLAACEAVDRAASEFAIRFRGFPLDDDDLTGGVSGSVNIDVEVWKVVRRAIAAARGGE